MPRHRSEGTTLLTGSGELFKRVLEGEGWSSRALVNWGRAMCLRAEMADSPALVEKLYQAAIDKFEAVLEEEPGMVPAKFRWGQRAVVVRGVRVCLGGVSVVEEGVGACQVQSHGGGLCMHAVPSRAQNLCMC
jgi:hypothetical protein